jgi:hypothetical protein
MGIKEFKPNIKDLAPVFTTVAGAAAGATVGYITNPDNLILGGVVGGALGITAYAALGFAYSYIMLPENLLDPTIEN